MTGFKSFPDKTLMHMNGSITGVVGPNGSGKSNVSDAVRWVLGEQSAKSLRGSVMQDVIFSGTEKRKERGFCEVSLIFDNSEARLSSEFSEIEVRRKLYRSGESEYYINGAKCRLKDILELFRDTGIGKEGYSIIGQGRIDEILSEKSIDRRKVFEEASGIMKYRVRKEESERKLEKTAQNLLRVEDILQEQNIQLKPLKRQAENARVYLELSDQLKTLEVNLFFNGYDKLKQKIAKLEESKKALIEDKAQREKQLSLFSLEHSNEQQSARQIEEKGDELALELSQALAKIEHIEGEIKLCEERELNLNKDSDRLRLEIDETEAKFASMNEKQEEDKARIAKIDEELGVQRQIVADTGKTIEELSGVYEDRVKSLETVQGEKVDTIEKLSDAKSILSALEEKRRSIKEKLAFANGRIAELEEISAKAALELDSETKAQNERQGRQSGLLAGFNENVFTLGKLKEETSKIKEELETAKRDYATCVSSGTILADMKNSFDGYTNSVRRLMTETAGNDDIGSRIIGTFADVISVPKEYETAIEMCLGAALQNVVVKTQDDAKHVIKYLRQNNIGRVTFLPLDALKVRSFSNQEKNQLDANGAIGVAGELIECRKGCEKALEFLLGRTVITIDNDAAADIIKNCDFGARAVSLDGDVFSPSGSITGGSVSRNKSGFVSRDRRQEELSKRAQELKDRQVELEKKAADASSKEQQLSESIEEARKELQEIQIETAKGKEKISALETAAALHAQESEKLEAQIKELADENIKLEAESERVNALMTEMRRSSDTKSEDYKRLEEQYSENTKLIEQTKAKQHEAEIKIAELMHENSALLNEIMRLEEEKNETQKAKMLKNKTIELNEESIENLRQLKGELEQLHGEKTALLDDIKRQQSDMISERSRLSQQISEHDKKIALIRQEHSDIAEKAMRVDFSIEKAQTDIEISQNRLWEMYQLTYANALDLRDDTIDISEAATAAEEMRRRIRFLGNVNPNAIEDYTELKERMDALEEQRNDLAKAKLDLEKLIATLLAEMRKTFKESFEQINKYFDKAFKDLFSGGRAELILEEGVDIMDAGIEIVAQPPGKKLQKISLLSGGEKALTAISLLFALLKINPSPVCILDEIDAALDEANVYKFSEYLKKYAKNMQFIVITHRKPTMIACDSLFGFAMEEKGVSKLLSVRLD